MRVNSINAYQNQLFVKNGMNVTSNVTKQSNNNRTHDLNTSNALYPIALYLNKTSNTQGISYITFTGGDKNIKQILSLPFENKATGLAEDSQGGLGVVTAEAPASFRKHEGLDVRSIMPFHQYNNPKGGFKFLLIRDIKQTLKEKTPEGEVVERIVLPKEIEARWFLSGEPGQTLEEFAKQHDYNPEDLRYVIQSEPNGKEATSLSNYCLIEPTSAKGEFERMSDIDIGKTQKVRYQLFKISEQNPPYNKLSTSPNYWMYTEELAKIPKPYTYGPEGHGGMNSEIINSDFCRAVLKAGEQMNTEEFGYFNPASFWGHDRPVSTFLSLIADESAMGNDFYNGTITHFTMHNPRRAYQGNTDNPFEFARMIFSPQDVESIRNHPQYDLLQNFNARGWENLTEVERNFVGKAFEPYIGQFKDFFGTYNITKIALNAKKVNPNNISVGTVSPNFDRQMKNPDMDVAPGLGADLREIETTSPLNGSTPANLGLNNNDGNFGRGNNTLSDNKKGFTPFEYDGTNIEEIIKKREDNAVWLTDILNTAEQDGANALNKVFYNDLQIEQGRSVLGSLSNYKKGDMLLMGWGRPDEQKGFPITLEGFKKFLMREDIPKEVKQRVHLLVGWGDLPFDKNSREWKLISKIFGEIQELDDGAYKGSLMLADGRFPNKLVGCATHCIFTSRDEICGITPFESKTAGVPYVSTAAGGPVDYTNKENGWLTKTAPELNPNCDGLTWDTPADKIDDARIARASDEVSDCLKQMTDEYFNDKPSYIARCKKNIEEKCDWHNNSEYNGGKTANEMYINDIWHINEGMEARDKSPMRRLVGASAEDMQRGVVSAVEKAKEAVEEKVVQTVKNAEKEIKNTKNKWVKAAIGVGVTFAAAGAAYAYAKKNGKTIFKKAKTQPAATSNTTQSETTQTATESKDIEKTNKIDKVA